MTEGVLEDSVGTLAGDNIIKGVGFMKLGGFPQYNVIDAVDLRVFDNRQQDYGMAKYIESIGFRPQAISLLENSIEQIHSNDGVIGNQSLPYLWCAEREMPGGNVWSRRQLFGLVEAAHSLGIKFYMGALCIPNKFAEYETRAEWLYENSKEYDLFITLADGSSLKETNGGINPLRRLPDGRLYEDVLLRDLLRYLHDYNMDGFFAGDGWCGLAVPLWQGDYHPDMIAQFEAFSGKKINEKDVPGAARAIWGNEENRAAWIKFYAARWTAFYKKLSAGIHEDGKELISLDPWARGPADALFDYGVDYRSLSEAGYEALCLQAREENWGRNGGDWFYSWEVGERVSIPAIRASAPDLKLHWAICICNAPEHWIATKDAMPVLERQSLSLPILSYIDAQGEWKQALDGLLFIFGTDASREEWDFIKTRWDAAFNLQYRKAMGPALVWSDPVLDYHTDKGKRWEFSSSATYMIMSGAPIHSAVNSRNLQTAQAGGYILIDPVGITGTEVQSLLEKCEQGAGLLVIGNSDNEFLNKAMGIKHTKPLPVNRIAVNQDSLSAMGLELPNPDDFDVELDIGDTITDGASVLLALECENEKRVLVSIRDYGQGKIVFIRRLRHWQKDKKEGRYFKTLKDYAQDLPDSIDRLAAGIASYISGSPVRSDKGQLYALQLKDGSLHLGVENMGTCFYNKITLNFTKELAMFEEYPMKRYTPAGYIHFDSEPKQLQVTVPQDSSLELKIKLKEMDYHE